MTAITVDFDVAAPMRDGTRLRANVYHPTEGRWPVLLTRLPYGKDLPLGSSFLDPVQAARRGYVVVVQDTRGRFASEGDWYPMVNEPEDGFDTVAWAAGLPYADGQVGMYGASYFGFTQWSAATLGPPALKAMVPLITWDDPANGLAFRGGAFELGLQAGWQLQMGLDVLVRRHRADPASLGRTIAQVCHEFDALATEGYWSLPLAQLDPLRRTGVAPAFFDSVAAPLDSPLAEPLRIRGKHDRIGVPTLNVGGWFDIFLSGTIAHFTAMRQRGVPTKLLIGPWSHSTQRNPVGELSFGFGAQASFIDLRGDFGSLQLRWFDHWLKGVDTGLLSEAPIRLFVMGANVWRDEQEWPLARAVETPLYLRAGGALSPAAPASEPPDEYVYDPAHPVPTHGGALLMPPEYPAGPMDQRDSESRPDVLSFTGPLLDRDTEVTGPVTVVLWAASSAPDTDFVARLVDVWPDGRAYSLTDGIVRARFRHWPRDAAPALIEPGRAYAYTIDLWATSNVFKAGHRIRLDVTSSCFPRWDRNLNTGEDPSSGTAMQAARQAILHDADHPSHVLLPIVPA